MLAPLATQADLAARNINLPTEVDPDVILASASASVREAAGCPISQAVSTVTLVAFDQCGLDLPGVPVASVASVQVEGQVVAQSTLSGCWSQGWRLAGDRLLFNQVWFATPATVTVTYTHGLPVVPDDIIDLVCGVASIAGAAAAGDGYGAAGWVKSVRLGDYSETYQRPAGVDSQSPVAIPDAVRDKLRARFGTSIAVLSMQP